MSTSVTEQPHPYTEKEAEFKFLVYLRDVTVMFDGFKALDIKAWGVYHNELRVVIGPNGAGKTTLFNLISGDLRADGGRIEYAGRDVSARMDRCFSG